MTTLIGTKTLGEEYCDIFYVLPKKQPVVKPAASSESKSNAAPSSGSIIKLLQTPSLKSRALYILLECVTPLFFLNIAFPKLKRWVQGQQQSQKEISKLLKETKEEEESTNEKKKRKSKSSKASKLSSSTIVKYRFVQLLSKIVLDADPSAYTEDGERDEDAVSLNGAYWWHRLMAFHLALFYFQGKYYSLSKRIVGLRYMFGHKVDENSPSNGGSGYEVLGVLLFVQLLGQTLSDMDIKKSWLWRKVFSKKAVSKKAADKAIKEEGSDDHEENDEDKEENNIVLKSSMSPTEILATITVEPKKTEEEVISLEDPNVLPYISSQSRTCVLCLSFITNPTATTCGHVFCWNCICEWCREKPECPLCRTSNLEQNLLLLK